MFLEISNAEREIYNGKSQDIIINSQKKKGRCPKNMQRWPTSLVIKACTLKQRHFILIDLLI